MRNADFPLHPGFNMMARLGAVAVVAWALTSAGFNSLAHARTAREAFVQQTRQSRQLGETFALKWPDFSQKYAILAP